MRGEIRVSLLIVFLLISGCLCITVPDTGKLGNRCFDDGSCESGLICDREKWICVEADGDIVAIDAGKDVYEDVMEDIAGDVCVPNCEDGKCGDDGCGGSCGSCGSNTGCTSGKCECLAGYGNCDNDWSNGCEANFAKDAKHCGDCATDCGDNTICNNKVCVCISDYENCDGLWNNGCEINFSSINSCGTDCNNKKDCNLIVKNVKKIVCKNSICDYDSCIYPYENADNNRTNGCEYWSYFPKTYGGSNIDYVNSIQQTSDGGFVVAGYTNSFGAGNSDFWVIRLNSNGDIIWQKTYGGSSNDGANTIQQTSDGGFVVAGYTNSFGAGNSDFWVIKLNSNGDIIWQKTYGGGNTDIVFSIQQTSDGGLIAAGSTESFGAGGLDFWVIRLNSNGDIIWQKTYGGNVDDKAYSIQNTTDGGFVVAGYTNSFGAGNSDFWVIKLNSNGEIIWQQTYGGSDYDEATSIQKTTDGGFIVAGITNSFNAGSQDFCIIKLNSNGEIIWQQTYEGSNYELATSIQQTSDGGLIAAGSTESFGAGGLDFWVIRLNSDGEIIWQKTYGGSGDDYAYSIQHTSDDGFVVVGRTNSFNAVNGDIWVLKLDSDGKLMGNCGNIEQTSDATVKNITISPANSNAAVTNTNATINNTTVSPKNTNCTVQMQCTAP